MAAAVASNGSASFWYRWMGIPGPLPSIDGLIAATALVRSLIVVVRNMNDLARTGVTVLNPFVPLP